MSEEANTQEETNIITSEAVVQEPAASEPIDTAQSQAPEEAADAVKDEVASPAPEGDAKQELARLADAAATARLSPADEETLTRLAKESLLGGRAGVTAAIDALPKMPWILGVRAVEAAWPDLTSGFRTQLLSGLAKMETDASRRIRLSLARSLSKIDLPVGIKIAGVVCKEMWDKETASLSAENSKVIGNVFIGRGKPWILQLPLAELKAAEADALLHCVVASAFNYNNPPITQLSILRYASQDGRLGNLHPNLLTLIAKSVGRWSPKWQDGLRKDVPELPETISSALRPPGAQPQPAPQQPRKETAPRPVAKPQDNRHDNRHDDDHEPELPPELEEKLEMAAETGDAELLQAVTLEVNTWKEAHRQANAERHDAHAEDERSVEEQNGGGRYRNDRNDRNDDRERDRKPKSRKERPVYVSREQEARGMGSGGGNFSLSTTLKQIENYCQNLRNDLAAAQNRLRHAEDDQRRNRRPERERAVVTAEDVHLSPEELQRLNHQLEGRIAELQMRVEELTNDSEARAVSMKAGGDTEAPDPATQLRTLISLKLEEDYADFLALDNEAPDIIVQQHYRDLIRHVFAVLAEEGFELKVPPTDAVQ